MPYYLTESALQDKVIDGNVEAYHTFVRHAAIKAFKERNNVGEALNAIYKDLRERLAGSHWAMIFYPSGHAYQSSLNRSSSITLSFARGNAEYQLFIARIN